MKMLIALSSALALAAPAAVQSGSTAAAGSSCDTLTSLRLANGAITLARSEPAGAVAIAGAPSLTAPRGFCRIAAALHPSPDSDVRIEVWMPTTEWNGKFQGVGNGAFSGAVAYPAMMAALSRGYATASTDTGHEGNTASFALGHPEKIIDFGWRAVHEMTVAAKAIVAAYYDRAPQRSYWTGCSAGGRQALKSAQRFPADYDGIVAGAPGHDWTGRAGRALEVARALEHDPAARLMPAQTRLLHNGALAACDATDGVADGVIDNPAQCQFNPAVLQCTGTPDESCLSPAQVRTAALIYSSQENPKTGRRIAGLYPGSELGWTDLGWTASARATGLDQFRFIVFKDPAWTIDRFTFSTDIVKADEVDDGVINALDPNLAPFLARGGKLIQYHGWSDPQISPGASVDYYEQAVRHLGGVERASSGYRLFMVPGMGHCGGGNGPNRFDMLTALEGWVEHGRAPDLVLAERTPPPPSVRRSRPLCPYPQRAMFKGTGSTDEAANFTCALP